MKKLNFFRVIIALALILTGTLPSLAYDFEVDGIYYNITSDTDKTVEVTNQGSSEGDYTGSVVIPSSVTNSDKTYSVTAIGNSAFYYCSGLTSVTIPNSVTKIEKETFYQCTGLTDVAIPNTVTSIGESAFCRCTGLTSITIPESVTSIGNNAFNSCTGLTEIVIPNSVTKIGAFAFLSTGWYKSQPDGILYLDNCCLGYKKTKPTGTLEIKDGTRLIADHAFSNCSGLTEVTVPNSVTSISDYAFYYCSGLTEVTIGNSVTSISDYAFSHCSSLTEVTIGNSVTSIGQSAFSHCSGLTEVTIPNSVTSIGTNAFEECDGLTSVTIGNSVTSIGNSAFYGTRLTEVTIPELVTSIGNSAFAFCPELTTINFNATNCTYMGCVDYPVFGGYIINITTLNIGKNVTNIPNQAFAFCDNIKNITSLNTTPPKCYASTFSSSIYNNAILSVPADCIEIYQSADIWCNFYNIKESGIENVNIDQNNSEEVARYDIYGRQLTEPTKGINIVKMSDGSTRKEYVK